MTFNAHRPRRIPLEGQSQAIRQVLPTAWGLAAVLTGCAVLASVLAPPDALQGHWQRLMYIHVPAAWVAYLAFAGVLAASLAQLRPGADRRQLARSGGWAIAIAEIGVAATALALLSGSVWGRAVWGVWWTWDARLVATALMLVVYVGYLGAAAAARDRGFDRRRARRAAWTGVAGFAIVPVVHFSVVWWTTLHQQATVLAPPTQALPLDPRMAVALALSVLAALILASVFVLYRTRHLGEDEMMATGLPEASVTAVAIQPERLPAQLGAR